MVYAADSYSLYTLFCYKQLLCKKLVLGQPNRLETFSTQATEVKKLKIFSFVFLITILRVQQLSVKKTCIFCGTNSYI